MLTVEFQKSHNKGHCHCCDCKPEVKVMENVTAVIYDPEDVNNGVHVSYKVEVGQIETIMKETFLPFALSPNSVLGHNSYLKVIDKENNKFTVLTWIGNEQYHLRMWKAKEFNLETGKEISVYFPSAFVMGCSGERYGLHEKVKLRRKLDRAEAQSELYEAIKDGKYEQSGFIYDEHRDKRSKITLKSY